MAALGEGFELCSFARDKDFVGLTVDRNDDDAVIVTSKANVTAYKLSHQKAIHSWSCKSNQMFTCPASQTTQPEEYSVVQQNKILRLWKSDDIDVSKWKKYSLSQPVHQILTSSNHRQPVVVYENGSVCELQSVVDKPKLTHGSVIETGEIIESVTLVDEDKVVIVVQHEKTHDVSVIIQTLSKSDDGDDVTTQKLKMEKPTDLTENHRCLCHCIQREDKNMALFTLWNNGCVYRNIMTTSPNVTLQTTDKLFTIQGFVTDDKDLSVAMTALSDSYIATVGLQDNQSKEFLIIWDITYGTPLCKQEINVGTTRTNVSKQQQIFTAGSNILVLVNKALMVYSYTLAPSTLAGVLGRGQRANQDTAVQSIVPLSAWNVHSTTESNRSTGGKKTIDTLVGKLSDESQTNEEFASTLEKVIKLCSNKDSMLYLTPVLLQCIVQRSSRSSDFWPRSSVQSLIKGKQLPATCCIELFQFLIDKEDLSLLTLCFKHMTDIPEKTLINCLQFYLSVKKDAIFDDFMKRKQIQPMVENIPTGCPLHKSQAFLINQVLVCPQNDVFVIDHLKKLPFDAVMDLLKYLCFLLDKAPVCLEEKNIIPTLEKVVEWLCVLLDAQFTQLVIVPEAKELLLQLQQQVEDQAQFFKELGSLEAVLQNLKSSLHEKPEKQGDVSLYRIEILKL